MSYRMYLINRRLKLNLSMNKVCKLVKCSRQHYYKVERGRSTTRLTFIFMCKIAYALGFTLEEMFINESKYLDSLEKKNEQD